MAARLGIAHSHVNIGDIEARYRTAVPTGLYPWETIAFERSAFETIGIQQAGGTQRGCDATASDDQNRGAPK